jgi:RNA polymerase sigma-32 factor
MAQTGNSEDITSRLAEKFGCTEDRVRRMEQRIDGRDVSLDAKAYRDGAVTIIDTLADERSNQETTVSRQEVSSLVRSRVERAMERLDQREQVIVQRRLLGTHKQTLSEVGRQLGLSRERVRQLEQRVKTKLRRTLADLAPEQTFAEAA